MLVRVAQRVKGDKKRPIKFLVTKPRAVLVVGVPKGGGSFEATMQRESEWAWGVVTADGGSAPLGRGLAVSKRSPPLLPHARPRTTTPFPHHINTPTPPLLRVFTRSVHSTSAVVLLL